MIRHSHVPLLQQAPAACGPLPDRSRGNMSGGSVAQRDPSRAEISPPGAGPCSADRFEPAIEQGKANDLAAKDYFRSAPSPYQPGTGRISLTATRLAKATRRAREFGFADSRYGGRRTMPSLRRPCTANWDAGLLHPEPARLRLRRVSETYRRWVEGPPRPGAQHHGPLESTRNRIR